MMTKHIRNFSHISSYKVNSLGNVYDAEDYSIEILTDAADGVWETYKVTRVINRYDGRMDDWDVFVQVDKSNSDNHWRILCPNRQRRRIHKVVCSVAMCIFVQQRESQSHLAEVAS